MGERHLCSHKNGGYIYSEELLRSGPYDPIRVGISVTCEKVYGAVVNGAGKSSAGNIFASPSLQL